MIYQTIIHSLESARKVRAAEVICCSKMTSFMALDGKSSFLRLKTLKIHVNECDVVLTGVLRCNGGKLEEDEDFKCVFVAYCVLESK